MKSAPPIAPRLFLAVLLTLVAPIYAPASTSVIHDNLSSPSPPPSSTSNTSNASTEKISPTLFMEGEIPKLDKNTTLTNVTAATETPIVKPVTSSVHARKGVSLEDIKTPMPVKIQSNTTVDFVSMKPVNTTNSSTTTTKKPIPKKPLITSGADEIPPLPEPIPKEPIVITNSTSSTTTKISIDKVVKEEIVSESTKLPEPPKVETQEAPTFFESYFHSAPSKQPGFIIPIVITIFAVPFLALIGYQAIRRGKEAWRNRHYRRMDYLIDGMYND